MKKRYVIGGFLVTIGSIELIAILLLILAGFSGDTAGNIIVIVRCIIEISIGFFLIIRASSLKRERNAN